MGLQSIVQIIMAMILMFLIMYLAYRFTGFLAKRTMQSGARGRFLREKDRLGMGPEQYIAIVQAGTGYYLIGVTKQNISVLAELTEEELQELPEEQREDLRAAALDSEFYRKLAEKTGGLKKLIAEKAGKDRDRDDQ